MSFSDLFIIYRQCIITLQIRSSPEVPVPKCRRSLRSEERENYSVNNNSQSLHMEEKRSRRRNTSNTSNLSETEELLDQSASYDTELTENCSEEDEEEQFSHRSQNRSKTISPERDIVYSKKSKHKHPRYIPESFRPPEIEQKTNSSFCSYIFSFAIAVIVFWGLFLIGSKNGVQTQLISNPVDQKQLLFESIKSIQTTFNNQESDIWNDISSAINEVMSKTPKKPSIILLFAKEMTTMDCLATKLANASSIILQADSYLVFNPEDFGNNAGEIITVLNMHSPERKKVVVSMLYIFQI